MSAIPIIDISKLVDDNSSFEEKLEVAKQLGRACEEVGFLVLVGHNVPKDTIDNAWKNVREFFDLDVSEKMQYVFPQETNPFGYNALGSEILVSGKASEKGCEIEAAPDLKEIYSVGPSDPKAGFPPRILPTNPAGYAEALTTYYDSLNNLAKKILKGFALALDLPIDYFEQFVDHHASALRTINYPAIVGRDNLLPNQARASAHTDYGTITILRTDGPGLQVCKDVDPPVWIDVPHVENAFIINLGDLMRRWTNDKWLSTLHQVIIPSTDVEATTEEGKLVCRRRQSIAFFHNLNRDAVVNCIVKGEDEVPKYESVVAGDFLLQKHLASMGMKK